MLDQEKIKDILVLASKEVRNYFGYKNVEKPLMELEYQKEYHSMIGVKISKNH